VGKAVKIFLFFSDLAVRYVRFWLKNIQFVVHGSWFIVSSLFVVRGGLAADLVRIAYVPSTALRVNCISYVPSTRLRVNCERRPMVGLCEAKKKAEMREAIWEAGEKGVLLVIKRQKMHKKKQK